MAQKLLKAGGKRKVAANPTCLENALPRDEMTVVSMFFGAMGLDTGVVNGLEAA